MGGNETWEDGPALSVFHAGYLRPSGEDASTRFGDGVFLREVQTETV
jgi:hypothetical protein